MSTYISGKAMEDSTTMRVWDVSEFAKRYRLDDREEGRLVRLLGQFASEQELLMNATRAPLYR